MSNDKDEMQLDLEGITTMAKRLVKGGKLKENEVAGYIHDHMTGLGYKSRRSYYKEEKPGSGDAGSGFSFFGRRNSDADDD